MITFTKRSSYSCFLVSTTRKRDESLSQLQGRPPLVCQFDIATPSGSGVSVCTHAAGESV